MRLRFFLLFYIILTGFQRENVMGQSQVDFGFHFYKKSRKQLTLPFELRANLIVINLKIDKSDTLNFVLDTGVRGVVLLDTTLKDVINFSNSRMIKIRGLGENETYNALVSVGHTISFGEMGAFQQNLILLDDDLINLSDYMGSNIHGIIGSDLFLRFNVQIDYLRKTITFSEPSKYVYKKRKGELVRLYFEKNKPYIKSATITERGQKFQGLNLVIDTGGSHALLLNEEHIDPGAVPAKLVDGHLGRGLNGKIEGKLGRIEQLDFGGQTFKNVVTAFPTGVMVGTESERYAIFRQGSIGGEILKRFIVNFNYSQGFMVLKPVRGEIHRAFQSDMSGIDLKMLPDKEIVVSGIVPNSAAQLGGLLEGDQIIIFNKRPVERWTISEIFEELRRKEGVPVQIIVRRGNFLEEVNFKLKKII